MWYAVMHTGKLLKLMYIKSKIPFYYTSKFYFQQFLSKFLCVCTKTVLTLQFFWVFLPVQFYNLTKRFVCGVAYCAIKPTSIGCEAHNVKSWGLSSILEVFGNKEIRLMSYSTTLEDLFMDSIISEMDSSSKSKRNRVMIQEFSTILG